VDFRIWNTFNKFNDLNVFLSIVTMVVFAANLMFVFNFFYSIFKGRKVRSTNPWGATSLEWTTPINPGHGNWPGEIPAVYRWAYDYGKDGRDFIPQTEPVNPNESLH
jgi:cytochrome c oxidase subunit 1